MREIERERERGEREMPILDDLYVVQPPVM